MSWIDGIRMSFEDYDRTKLEKDYTLLRQYMPLVRAPGKQNFLLNCTAYMYLYSLSCVESVRSILIRYL